MKRMKRHVRVAFQGAPGANSEVALRRYLPEARPLPCATFEEVFDALARKRARYAFIPIENSIAGRVADIHHLLPHSRAHIVGEHYEPIHHFLLGTKQARLTTVREVYSHVHALGQCRAFIERHGLRKVVHSDTAAAARDVAAWGDPSKAAIATALAGELYGLKVLARRIEDTQHNTTRFLLLARRPLSRARLIGTPVITTILFTLKSVPAALYKAIGGFATNGINMTKIESYLAGPRLEAAQFYVDVEAHPDSRAMRLALDELAHFSRAMRILGVYPASPFRTRRAAVAGASTPRRAAR